MTSVAEYQVLVTQVFKLRVMRVNFNTAHRNGAWRARGYRRWRFHIEEFEELILLA